jgi:hypothetical protein
MTCQGYFADTSVGSNSGLRVMQFRHPEATLNLSLLGNYRYTSVITPETCGS